MLAITHADINWLRETPKCAYFILLPFRRIEIHFIRSHYQITLSRFGFPFLRSLIINILSGIINSKVYLYSRKRALRQFPRGYTSLSLSFSLSPPSHPSLPLSLSLSYPSPLSIYLVLIFHIPCNLHYNDLLARRLSSLPRSHSF